MLWGQLNRIFSKWSLLPPWVGRLIRTLRHTNTGRSSPKSLLNLLGFLIFSYATFVQMTPNTMSLCNKHLFWPVSIDFTSKFVLSAVICQGLL